MLTCLAIGRFPLLASLRAHPACLYLKELFAGYTESQKLAAVSTHDKTDNMNNVRFVLVWTATGK